MNAMNKSSDTDDAGASVASNESDKLKRSIPRRLLRVKLKRQIVQSTIGFPYKDLDTAVSVALAILQAGGVALTTEQLAGVMGLQVGSGNFVIKIGTARTFGLIANTGGKYELTPLGFSIVDTDERRQRMAPAEAFLTLPFYRPSF